MPWMPEVFTAPIAAARRAQDEEATSTNDAVPYYEGILADEPEALVRSFAARQPVLATTPESAKSRAPRSYAPSPLAWRSGCVSATRLLRT